MSDTYDINNSVPATELASKPSTEVESGDVDALGRELLFATSKLNAMVAEHIRLQDELNATPEKKRLDKFNEKRMSFQETANHIEYLYKNAVLAAYKSAGKKDFEFSNIVIRTQYNYDQSEAIKWAAEHNLSDQLVVVSLNARAFNKVAQTMNIPFVEIVEEPSVNVKRTELSKRVADLDAI